MKPYARKASVVWLGTSQRGKGAISTPSAALSLALHAANGDTKRSGTNPPELMAAAHAGSFTLTLANELAKAGYRPRQIDTTATITMENLTAGWTLTQIDLEVIAAVPRVAECAFVDAALRAKANCPISRALNANISMRARLNRRETLQGTKPRRKSGLSRPAEAKKSSTIHDCRFPETGQIPEKNHRKLNHT
jgi:lipoyl-dependent peroxiredoxin